MTPDEVRAIIAEEIGDNWAQSNSHGVQLRECLVKPRKLSCRNTFPELNNGKPLELWLVLEETPGNSDGYLIVFDDVSKKFGLADWDRDGTTPVFLGYHGSFLNTLQGM